MRTASARHGPPQNIDRTPGSYCFASRTRAHVVPALPTPTFAPRQAIAAAKAGVQGLALSAAASYSSAGIRVNCVAPGLVRPAS